MIKKILAVLILLTLVLLSVGAVSAQQKSSGGVTITPAFQEIQIEGDQPAKSGTFSLKNNTTKPSVFELSTIDMGTLDETGGLIFSGLPQDYIKKYGLANWVELPVKRVEIQPNKSTTIKFNIRNDETLSPGGHYGAVLVKQASNQQSDEKQVTISPQAASLVFLLKRGGEKYGLSLQSAIDDHSIWNLPTSVDLNFSNEGNVHVIPRGIVRLENTFGDELSKAIINPESAYILPERSRVYGINFENLPKTIWPGRYRVEVEYRYDGSEEIRRYTYTFFTANLKVLSLLLLVLSIFGFLIFRFRKHIKKFVKKSWKYFQNIVNKLIKLPNPKK